MEKIIAGTVAGVASKAGDGIQVLDINDEIMNLETDKWVQGVVKLLDATCGYINNGTSTSCSGIDTQYGSEEPEHPKEILKKEGNQLLGKFISENVSPDKLLSMLTKYEKIVPKSVSQETESDESDKSTKPSTQNEACVCEKPVKKGGDVKEDEHPISGGTEVAVATAVGGNVKHAGIMSGGAAGDPTAALAGAAGDPTAALAGAAGDPTAALAGAAGDPTAALAGAAGDLGGAGSVADMLKPGGTMSSNPKKIVKTIVDKQVKYTSCNKIVHDRIKDMLSSIFRNSLRELNKDADENVKSIFKEHIEFSRKKINDERINIREDKLKLFAPLLTVEDEKYKLFAIKGYVTTLAEMYEYLQYREKYENGKSVKKIINTHKGKINNDELLKEVLKDLPKKYNEFAKLMGGEANGRASTMDAPTEGNIFQNIMSMGGKKKRKHRFTKKRRKPKHNRTK
jgi:hypothetical protein